VRKVRKDGTVSYQGERFEVPYELSGQSIQLVVDPHAEQVMSVEGSAGESLGAATPLDAVANNQRTRRKPRPVTDEPDPGPASSNLVEMAYQHYHGTDDPMKPDTQTEES